MALRLKQLGAAIPLLMILLSFSAEAQQRAQAQCAVPARDCDGESNSSLWPTVAVGGVGCEMELEGVCN